MIGHNLSVFLMELFTVVIDDICWKLMNNSQIFNVKTSPQIIESNISKAPLDIQLEERKPEPLHIGQCDPPSQKWVTEIPNYIICSGSVVKQRKYVGTM